MPTSTDIQNLKINTLTEAQFDTAVQGGVIGVNELSILTDAEAGQVIQVSTMPTASADELGNIYQFIGTTDVNYTNGYFYKCVSDGQTPATYSWTQTNVQPQSGGLPSQTGQSGKFLTTDGTDASWSDKPLVNTATGTSALTILGSSSTASQSINIGVSSQATRTNAISVGSTAQALHDGAIAIGSTSVAGASSGQSSNWDEIAIGNGAVASAKSAIQLGYGTNNDADTFQVWNHRLLNRSDGTIPTARLTKVNTTITLTAAGWSSNTQTVNVTGMTADGVVLVSPDPTDQADYTSAGIICSAQAAGTLTFTCSTTPSADLSVNVVML